MSLIDIETLRRLSPEVVREILNTFEPEDREQALETLRKWSKDVTQAASGATDGASRNGFLDLVGLTPGGSAGFDSPTLSVPEVPADFDESVIPTQLNAAADLYFVYQHERMKVFQVCGTLIRLFHEGRMRIQSGPGARALYLIEKHFPLRYKQRDRMLAYRRAFNYGSLTAPNSAMVYTTFHRQFLAFVSAVAQYYRDLLIGEVIRGGPVLEQRPFASQATIERLAIDLRWQLDRVTYGNIVSLTIETNEYLRTVFNALETPDIKKAFDANSKWDVIEEVSKRHLGGAADISNRAKMAESGRELLRFAASNTFRSLGQQEFQALIRPYGTISEQWIAAYRMTPEGRNFSGVTPALRSMLGLERAGARAT